MYSRKMRGWKCRHRDFVLGYHAYLRMRYLLPMADGALALIAALVILTVVLALELRQRSPLNGKIKKST